MCDLQMPFAARTTSGACRAPSPNDDAFSECSVVDGQQRYVYRCLFDALSNPAAPNSILSCPGSRSSASHDDCRHLQNKHQEQLFGGTAQFVGHHQQARHPASVQLPSNSHICDSASSFAFSDCRHDISSYVQQWLQAAEATSRSSHTAMPNPKRADTEAACAGTRGSDIAAPTRPSLAAQTVLPPPAFYILGVLSHKDQLVVSQATGGHTQALDI